MSNNKRILWPAGAPDHQTPDYAATIELAIYDNLTIVDMPTLTGAPTVNLTADAELRNGAQVIINVDQDGTGRNVTWGSSVEGDDLSGVANDKDTVVMVYNKTAGNFRIVSNHKTVDAA